MFFEISDMIKRQYRNKRLWREKKLYVQNKVATAIHKQDLEQYI